MIALFVEFVAWLARYFGAKWALYISFAALVATLYATMIIVVAAALASVSTVVPQYVTDGIGMFLPSQTGAAMAAVMTARAARWVYDQSLMMALAFNQSSSR